jgi:hypothetical protein
MAHLGYDSEGEQHFRTSSFVRCSRPIVVVKVCYKRAIGVGVVCRWDVGRQCGARRRRRGELKPPTFNFFATRSLYLTLCAKPTEGQNCPKKSESGLVVCVTHNLYSYNAKYKQILQIVAEKMEGATGS